MIGSFESMVRRYPERVCFTFVDKTGQEERYTYRHTRLVAAALARELQESGVHRGDCVVVDLPNCPAFVYLVMAAAYGAFTLAPLNHRLTVVEKHARMADVGRARGAAAPVYIDERRAASLMERIEADLAGKRPLTEGAGRASKQQPWGVASLITSKATPSSTPAPASARRGRVIMGAQQDAEEEAIHFAERQARLFDDEAEALVMFTSGTTGKPKEVPLTWRHLMGSAQASNAALGEHGKGLWQAALPLYHIGGFQVVMRSLLNHNPFVLYERFDAARVLADALRFHATHVSVVDKMLQDLLAADTREVLPTYRCVLLGGGALNRKTLASALSAGARVFASYGMTETSSQIAHSLVTRSFNGGLRLLPGYAARIVDPNAEGYGRLAVRGPGVFSGYRNAHAAFTVDGYFLTGDTAALRGGLLHVKERTADMFVSGGENVYPAEIADKLMHVAGVADAFVLGVPDATWGRRPVAFVERDGRGAANACTAAETLQAFAARVRASVETSLSKLYLPRQVFAVDELPRTGIGKIDRAAVERMYEQRLEVKRVTLYRVRLPFKTPFKTAKATLTHRDSIIVEVTDHAGRTGLGECVAFETDWYLPETLEHDAAVLQHVLAPKVLSEVYMHPREVSAALESLEETGPYPLARGALEPALWDLYGKIVGKPLWKLIGEEAARLGLGVPTGGGATAGTGTSGLVRPAGVGGVPAGGMAAALAADVVARGGDVQAATVAAGAVVGLGSPAETVEAVRRCVEAGYRRVKLKVAPGGAAARVRAVRQAFPQLMITLDANQSFTDRDRDELRALAACGVAWIEEPIDVSAKVHPSAAFGGRTTGSASSAIRAGGGVGNASNTNGALGVSGRLAPRPNGARSAFDHLASLQRGLSVPVCLDESFTCAQEAYQALERPELRCFAVKIGKFGGIEPALEFVRTACARGASVWMGGMYDTGISKRMHAAFQTLPCIDVPGDIGASSRYFSTDIADPPYTVERGLVTLNRKGHESGLGCELCRSALANVLVKRTIIE